MNKFFSNFERLKKEVDGLGVTGEQILVEFVKNYQNLQEPKSEFGTTIIDVDIMLSKNEITFEAKTKNGNMEIIASTPKSWSSIDDDREVSMSGQILVR
ncbi:MAG: hypothetical protein ACRC5G_01390 [Cetobacterium sp.]